MSVRKISTCTVLLAATLGLTACTGSLPEDQVEENVTDQLEKMAGQRPDKVDCPGDLKAEVGTKMRCTLTAGSDELGLTVTVTEVEGTSAKYDIEVDEQ